MHVLAQELNLFFVGRDFHHSEVAVAVAAPWRVFARDPEGGAMRVGMRREHHEVMVVVTAGLIEGRKRISMTTAFAHVGKVVAEMLGRFEFNFFSDRVGDRAV